MNKTDVNRFNELYQRHLRSLKFQGKSQKPLNPTLGPSAESVNILIVVLIN